jgi:hypothetical protein
MRRSLVPVLVLLAGFIGAGDSYAAVRCPLQTPLPCSFPQLVSTFGASVSPRKLSRRDYTPVTTSIFGKISTSDNTHPSALRQVDFDIDKDARINSRNYPACKGKRRAMEVLNTKAALKVCRKALLGRGKAIIEVALPESKPILLSNEVLIFNGGEQRGVTKLLIHLFISVPRPSAIVAEVAVTRRGAGLDAVANIPAIAGGFGSVLDFKFELGKTYSYKGKKYGYFEAKCPDEVFKANVTKFLFKNEARVPGKAAQTVTKGALAALCTPQG